MTRTLAVSPTSGRSVRRAFGAALAVCFLAAVARAEPPVWVIEDEDSTLYLFGTVHVLDPEIEWFTPRIEQALGEAGEVWFELPMPASMEEMQAHMLPAMLQRALSPDRPLSSLLTDEEKDQLARALARTPAPEQLGMALENMKPWFAIMTLGAGPLMSAGYEAEAGVDMVLAGIAHERGVPVRGFETLEQHSDFQSGSSEEEQLEALRIFLSFDDETFDAELARGDAAFRVWMTGETAPLDAIITDWSTDVSAMREVLNYDVMVANRNEDWAGQIEDMLTGAGVAFIAVGAGHLVGPDSVQARLAVRGISAERR